MQNEGEWLRVELFGDIKSEHSAVLNYQLQEQLKEFDKMYAQGEGLRVGSLVHQLERQEFAKMVSQSLVEYSANNEGQIIELNTKTKYSCMGLKADLTIKSSSKFTFEDIPHPHFSPN